MTLNNLIEKIKNLSDYGIIEIMILFIGLFFMFFLVFFLIPYISLASKKNKQRKEKLKKKQLMDRIILQKNLEDVITKELKQKSNLIDEK